MHMFIFLYFKRVFHILIFFSQTFTLAIGVKNFNLMVHVIGINANYIPFIRII